jgi:hypothetical protein
MAENSRDRRERAGADARSQQEADAQLVREKTARLRALRLARDAEAGSKTVNNTAKKTGKKTADSVASVGTPAAARRKPRNSGKAGLSLSEWLAAQQKDGRHN